VIGAAGELTDVQGRPGSDTGPLAEWVMHDWKLPERSTEQRLLHGPMIPIPIPLIQPREALLAWEGDGAGSFLEELIFAFLFMHPEFPSALGGPI
jgi:hypothetical protein